MMATDWKKSKEQGNEYYKASKFEDALACYNQALGEDDLQSTNKAFIHNNKAACYIKMGNYKKVIEEASLCLEVTPRDVKALFRRCKGLENEGRIVEALQDATQLVELEPDYKAAKAVFNRLGAILQQQNKTNQEFQATAECTRCGEAISKKKCLVSHPAHLRVRLGYSLQIGTGSEETFQCNACHQKIVTATKMGGENAVTIEGPKWCFKGKHSSTPIPESDQRICSNHIVSINYKQGKLQKMIENELSPTRQADVKILGIDGLYDDSQSVSLCHRISNLTKLQLSCVYLTKLHLTTNLTPSVTDLEIHECGTEDRYGLEFNVVLPLLKNFSMRQCQPAGGSSDLNKMLAAATKLEKFDSYKLWVVEELFFASNHLKVIDLHRADSLNALSFWAPELVHLNLQGAYAMEKINILKYHPILSKDLPRGHRATKFICNTINANISKAAMNSIKDSGRAQMKAGTDRSVKGGLEAMWAAQRRS